MDERKMWRDPSYVGWGPTTSSRYPTEALRSLCVRLMARQEGNLNSRCHSVEAECERRYAH